MWCIRDNMANIVKVVNRPLSDDLYCDHMPQVQGSHQYSNVHSKSP